MTISASPAQEKYHDPNPVVRFVLRRFFHGIGTALEATGAATLLDAGCGEGELMRRHVLPPDLQVISLDLRHESLAYFRTHSAQRNLVCGSVESLPLPDKSVDAALCLEVLEHLEDPRPAVRELVRVARQAVILSVPYEPWFRLGNVLRGKHLSGLGNHPEHVQHWNQRQFRAFLEPHFGEIRLFNAVPWIIALCRC